MANADCIIIQGSNMAECHPVGFQWVSEAKARGARVIHIDPRFTRTSAIADTHVPIRAGSDVVLLGALINHVLSNDLYFREYVVAYTNAATLVSEDFVDTEDLDGVFSGFDPATGKYDMYVWAYAEREDAEGRGRRRWRRLARSTTPAATTAPRTPRERRRPRAAAPRARAMEHANVVRDETLEHPRTVFQVLKRHYARYTPEMVQEMCGIPVDQFHEVARALTENSGRERTTCFAYALGWTQHSLGAQFIRTAAILQLLMGNMGRPGGGIMALRGHASIQGSTDIPTLFNLLPGYLPMPMVGAARQPRRTTSASIASPKQKGFWTEADAYTASLLKAWWGDAATPENDFCFDYLPRLTGAHGTYQTAMAMIDDEVDGYFVLGQNPAVGSAHGKMQREALSHLKWMVVRDFQLIETATFWKDGPEVASGEIEPRGHRDGGLLLPGRQPRREVRAPSPRPSGCSSGTTRR